MNHFTAKIRVVRVETLEVAIAAASLKEAQGDAKAAAAAMRDGKTEAMLTCMEDHMGRAVFTDPEWELPAGCTEVTWKGRFPTLDPEVAACHARIALADPDSAMVFFETRSADGRIEFVDLQREGLLH